MASRTARTPGIGTLVDEVPGTTSAFEQRGEPPQQNQHDDSISLIEIANILLRWRWLVVALPLALLFMTAARLLLEPRQYTATASFMPHRAPGSGRSLGNVAAQLGIALPGTAQGESPEFYAELLTSRAILAPALETTYTFPRGGREVSGTLIDVYQPEGDGAARREAALRRLGNDLRVNTSRTTDIVRTSVTASSPVLAEQVLARVLELVNQFNLETRQSQAREERKFVEARMAEAQNELRAGEDELERFLQQNRAFQNSPQLALVHGRLEREVMMRQQVFTTLAQAYEQARIEEVRNLPVITIIEAPARPVYPDGRGLVVRAVLALLAGLALAVVLAVALDFFRTSRAPTENAGAEFERLRRATLEDLRRPWRRLLHPAAD